MGLFDWIGQLKNNLGAIADAIIPGDQSSWHPSAAPAPAPSAPQRQAAAQIGGAVGLGPSNPSQPMSAPAPVTPTAAPIFKLQPPPLVAPQVNMPLEIAKQAITGSARSIGNAAVGLAHGIADVAPTVAVQGASVLDPNHDYSFQATDPVRKFIFGGDKITPIVSVGGTNGSGQANEFGQWLQAHGLSEGAANAAIVPAAGLIAAADLFSGGKGKTAAEAVAKEATTGGVSKILESYLGKETAAKIPQDTITALAAEKNPGNVQQVLKDSLSGLTEKSGAPALPPATQVPHPVTLPETAPGLPAPSIPASNSKKVSLPDILPSLDKTVNPGIKPEDVKWAQDNGFAPKNSLGLDKKSLQPEGVTQAQLDRAPSGIHMGNSKAALAGRVNELHAPNPVRRSPETPMLSDAHVDVPGKAPYDVKQPTISLQPPKNESSLVKGFGAAKTIIGRQGEAGKELAQRMVNVRESHAQLGQVFKDSVPTVLKLGKGSEFKNFVDTVEGRTAPASQKVAQAVNEWQTTAKTIEGRAQQAGISMGHIEDYFPHMYDNKLFTDQKTFQAAAEHLVNSGQATDLQNAVQQINGMREPWQGGHRFGNLEKARNANIPGYQMNKKVVMNYLDKSARRIAEVEQFGRDNGHVDNLVAQMAKEGKDANAAQHAFNSYWQRPATGMLDKAANIGRKSSSYLTLSKAALSHSTQTANTAIVTGNIRTAHAWIKSLGGKDRAWAKSIGINYDGHAGNTISGIAPGLRQMRAQNRIVSALAGRAYGRALAKSGKTDILANKWGVQGAIGKTLTPAQEAHMGHAMADATQFSDDPADLPTWARTPAGKLVGQYRMSYQYKQGGFLFDHVLKEARNGNIMPAIRALAVIPAAGATVVEAKHLLGSKTTPSDPMAVAEAGGLGTVPTALLGSTRYMYNGPTAAATIAGDVAPLAGQLVQTGENVASAARGNTAPLGKQALGYIPFVGTLVKNAVYPSKTADPNAIAYVQNMDSARKSLSASKDQAIFDALYGSNKDSAGNKIPASYDPNNSPYVAEALLSHPNVLAAATSFYQAFGQQTGQTIDPLYNLNPQQQQAALELRAASAFPGELKEDKSVLTSQLPGDWTQQQDAYYKSIAASLVAAGKPSGGLPGAPQYPQPSAQVAADLKAGNTKNNPGVSAYLNSITDYNNQKRQDMGLPQIAAYGTTPSSSQITNPSTLSSALKYASKTGFKVAPSTDGTANQAASTAGLTGGSGSRKAKSIKIAKGSGVKKIKMPKVAVAKAPRLPKIKVARVAAAPKQFKIAGIKAPKKLKLA